MRSSHGSSEPQSEASFVNTAEKYKLQIMKNVSQTLVQEIKSRNLPVNITSKFN